ncbi:MAG: hypothetical protein QF385_15125, partial [SAR324 cluster bacterium]|nr:hypothetical protein [SAR324 cluster bacterium]
DSSRATSLLAREGNTLTLKFETREEIVDEDASGTNLARVPEVTFSYLDENGEDVTRSATVVSSEAEDAVANRSYVATYTLDDTDSGIESDVDYQIRIHDRSGNVREYADVASVEAATPAVVVANTLRIDTKLPDLSSISFETDNDGMSDSSRATSLLAREGNTLTLKFETREE